MTEQSLAVREAGRIVSSAEEWDDSKRELLARTIAKGASSDELDLFIAVCRRTGLDPFSKQAYFIKYRDRVSIVIGIDGYRLIAERTGKYAGQLGPLWADEGGQWHDVWVANTPPTAAKVAVIRRDFAQPLWATCRFKSYVQQTPLWQQMPEVMLAKCAEGLAFRKAFPLELSGYQQAAPEMELPEVARDEQDQPVPSRAPAIVAGWEASGAEADAQLAEPFEEVPTELPGPRWGSGPLGRAVAALVDALTAAGLPVDAPAPEASDDDVRAWELEKRAALRAHGARRPAR